MLDRTIHHSAVASSPTEDAYHGFYQAFEFFNAELFDGKLPDTMITMQRSKRSRGYFSSERFGHRRSTDVVDEIALNPRAFIGRSDKEIISTLLHEMTHLWQFHFGKPSRGGYHNKQWSARMEEVGLMPSHTGEAGGKKTGQQMTHYIIKGGAYDTKWKALIRSGYKLDYQDRQPIRPQSPRKLKVRYACPECSIHVWGKSDLRITCTDCSVRMR